MSRHLLIPAAVNYQSESPVFAVVADPKLQELLQSLYILVFLDVRVLHEEHNHGNHLLFLQGLVLQGALHICNTYKEIAVLLKLQFCELNDLRARNYTKLQGSGDP
jgi:hypothetical protein